MSHVLSELMLTTSPRATNWNLERVTPPAYADACASYGQRFMYTEYKDECCLVAVLVQLLPSERQRLCYDFQRQSRLHLRYQEPLVAPSTQFLPSDEMYNLMRGSHLRLHNVYGAEVTLQPAEVAIDYWRPHSRKYYLIFDLRMLFPKWLALLARGKVVSTIILHESDSSDNEYLYSFPEGVSPTTSINLADSQSVIFLSSSHPATRLGILPNFAPCTIRFFPIAQSYSASDLVFKPKANHANYDIGGYLEWHRSFGLG
ncbi:hypothetical protein GYMLUDRAFT_252150 [Collybiopsis luxurians FD-317 M1]|uniref:Uncharacterized protein n=1 Tax=Collybiopsis luxurians FD-317 M1 TaxID=944289 RepID=A0A0D0BAP6_9AGAR|nr:hypothetical protein GYMLUDRAFT_252150 [Collybiopsis luxurians FD-317 M1]